MRPTKLTAAHPRLALCRINGEDAADFLQAQLAADISQITPNTAGFAAYCTPKGKVVCLLLVFKQNDHFVVATESSLMAPVINRLRMYVLRSRVTFEPLPDSEVWVLPVGMADGEEELRSFALQTPVDCGFKYGIRQVADSRRRAAVLNPSSATTRAIHQAELSAGICWLQAETSERFIPQMLGFDALGAVSFTKGCYPGQEIVARTKYLGKLKRHPLLLKIEGDSFDLKPGDRCQIKVISMNGPETDRRDAVVVDISLPSGSASSADEVPFPGLVFLVAPVSRDEPVSELFNDHQHLSVRRLR